MITGVIKANFPARISFNVASKVDSRTVLDMNGADKLLGKGDMLFLKSGEPKPIRAQSTFITDGEIRRIVQFTKNQQKPTYSPELEKIHNNSASSLHVSEKDELYDEDMSVSLAALNRGVERCVRGCVEQYQWEYKRFRVRPRDGKGLYDNM